jgi:acetyl esterase
MAELDPEVMRARVREGDALAAPGPQLATVDDVRTAGAVPVRRYLPSQVTTHSVILWFHGGGWVTGDFGYSDAFCRTLAAGAGCEVRSVDYRLAPEHRFPAALDDALQAAREAGSSGRAVVLAGDSAGGNLAAAAALQLRHDPAVDLAGQVLVYPVLDADRTRASYVRNDGLVLGIAAMGWFFDQYVPDVADRNSPRFAPLRAPDLTDLPPTVLAVAGHDPLYDEGRLYAELLRQSGVELEVLDFPSLVHGFLRYTGPVPAAADAATRIVTAAATLIGRR